MAINNIKYELSSLRGCRSKSDIKTIPISMENGINVFPITIGEIEEIGEYNYNVYLKLLTIEKEEINNMMPDELNFLDIINETYDFLILYCSQGEAFKEIVEKSISFFIKKPVLFIKGAEVFAVGEQTVDMKFDFISKVNYNEFKEIIAYQNCIEKDSAKAFNPKNNKAKEIRERINAAKKKVKKYKKTNDDESLTFSDLVSVLTSSENDNGINLFNVWNLTIYQFNDQFTRMKMLEEFKVNIQQLLAGADPTKIELKHWMEKIK